MTVKYWYSFGFGAFLTVWKKWNRTIFSRHILKSGLSFCKSILSIVCVVCEDTSVRSKLLSFPFKLHSYREICVSQKIVFSFVIVCQWSLSLSFTSICQFCLLASCLSFKWFFCRIRSLSLDEHSTGLILQIDALLMINEYFYFVRHFDFRACSVTQ